MFPKKKAPLPVVLVRWNDASSDTEVFTEEKEHHTVMVATVGFLVRETKEGYTLSTDVEVPCVDSEFSFRVGHFIPRGMVHDITVIRK